MTRVRKILFERDEAVARLEKAVKSVRARDIGARESTDYREGYEDALLDTLDLLTGNVAAPLKEHDG